MREAGILRSVSTFDHPRRSLGNRHRAQAEKFLALSENDPERVVDNLAWAEQSCRQAILHDYTEEDNWSLMLKIKLLLGDGLGVQAVFNDLLNVLGRDAELIAQLRNVDLLVSGEDMLLSILKREPLDADIWWKVVEQDPSLLVDFAERCRRMDFRDRRSNVIFGRRLERIRSGGEISLFEELVNHLLAHRPDNFELWVEFGRHHEQNADLTNAWLCYDQAMIFNPNDQNKARLARSIEGRARTAGFKIPDAEQISSFQSQLKTLASRLASDSIETDPQQEVTPVDADAAQREQLEALLAANANQEAFFLARALLAEGEQWAEEYFDQARERISDE